VSAAKRHVQRPGGRHAEEKAPGHHLGKKRTATEGYNSGGKNATMLVRTEQRQVQVAWTGTCRSCERGARPAAGTVPRRRR
jgi:hypothetical protein